MICVTTTLADETAARRLAAQLVERRLAACVQISGPITSVYRWQGEIETGQEWLVVAKTSEALWEPIREAIDELHPYETPELIATPVSHAAPAYAAWLDQQLGAR